MTRREGVALLSREWHATLMTANGTFLIKDGLEAMWKYSCDQGRHWI